MQKLAAEPIKRAQINELYILRALAIMAVLMVHVAATGIVRVDSSSQYYPLYNFLNIGFRFGTPTFILLSSFVIFYNYYHRKLDWSMIKHFYSRRLLYILVPYAVFTLIFYYYKVHFYYGFPGWRTFLETYWSQLWKGNAHAHLYFVYVSVQFYLLFPLFMWVLQTFRKTAAHLVWFGFAVQWGFFIYNQYGWAVESKGTWALSYMSFYCLGAFIGIFFERVKDYLQLSRDQWRLSKVKLATLAMWCIWLASMIGHVAVWHRARIDGVYASLYWYELWWNLHAMFSALVLFQLSYWIYTYGASKLVNILIHLGVASFGVYLIHPLILIEIERRLTVTNGTLLHLVIGGIYLAVLFGSWVAVTLVFKVKGSWIVFGSRPRTIPYVNRSSSWEVPVRGTGIGA